MAVDQRPPAFRGRSSEREALDRLLEDARAGRSGVLVIRGEAGVGKTALMRYAADRAAGFRVAQIAGVESEMELPFAGLHQLCAPLLDRLDALPAPQQDALRVALGVASGAAPDRFLVGLATLSLLAEVAEDAAAAVSRGRSPVARRRLGAGARVRGAPAARRAGRDRLRRPRAERGARAVGPAGAAARRARSRRRARPAGDGRPGPARRARPRADHRRGAGQSAGPAGAAAGHERRGAGGRVRPSRRGHASRTSSSVGWIRCPPPRGGCSQLAAADPVGEPLLVWRAAAQLGIDPRRRDRGRRRRPARDRRPGAVPSPVRALGGLPLGVAGGTARAARRAGARPRIRSSIPIGAPGTAPRRRRRRTSRSPRSSNGRPAARSRAGASRPPPRSSRTRPCSRRSRLAARAACSPRRGRSATPARSTRRWSCWSRSRPGRSTRCRRRRSSSCAARSPSTSAASARPRGCSSSAARRLDSLDAELARTTHLKALGAAMWAGPDGLLEAAEAARAAPPGPDPPRTVDLLVDAFAIRVTEGYAAAAPALRQALEAVLALEVAGDIGRWLWLTGSRAGAIAALELWDADAWHVLADAPGAGGPRHGRTRAAAVRAPVPRQESPAGRGSGRGGAGRSRRSARSPRRPGPRRSPTPR